MNSSEIATKADIETLLKELHKIEAMLGKTNNHQKILRSADVRKLMNISDGTLQRLRNTGDIKAKKVNGTWFYPQEQFSNLISVNND